MKVFKQTFYALLMLIMPIGVTACGTDDEPDDDNYETGSGSQSGSNYNPNSDHALAQCLNERGYGSLTSTVKKESDLVGTWNTVANCTMYTKYLSSSYCSYDIYGLKLNSDGMAYYYNDPILDKTQGHSWHLENGNKLKIYWGGSGYDTYIVKWTSKGYLVLMEGNNSHWSVLKKN